MFEDIVRYSLISSTLKPIDCGELKLRAQINVLLNAPFGTGKTELLERVERAKLGYRMMNWTEVGLLGSIRKDGEIVPPMTIIAAGKTVLIDEFQSVPARLRLPLLSLMEEQRAERVLNFKVPTPVSYESKYWSVYANQGYMTFRMRSSFIIATSRIGTSHLDHMLQSRCIQINMQVGYEDLQEGIVNIRTNDIEDLRAELDNKQGKFKEKFLKEVLSYITEELRNREIPPNYAYRVTADTMRIMNIKELLGEDKDEAYDYLDFILQGILGSSFTPLEIKLYNSLNGSKPLNKILEELKIPESYATVLIERLMQKGMVKKVGRNVYSKV